MSVILKKGCIYKFCHDCSKKICFLGNDCIDMVQYIFYMYNISNLYAPYAFEQYLFIDKEARFLSQRKFFIYLFKGIITKQYIAIYYDCENINKIENFISYAVLKQDIFIGG